LTSRDLENRRLGDGAGSDVVSPLLRQPGGFEGLVAAKEVLPANEQPVAKGVDVRDLLLDLHIPCLEVVDAHRNRLGVAHIDHLDQVRAELVPLLWPISERLAQSFFPTIGLRIGNLGRLDDDEVWVRGIAYPDFPAASRASPRSV
jgi:hypothetical protein